MERIQYYKFNIFLYIIAVLAILVALININRTYKAEVDLMLVARNDATAKNMDRIIEDARIIPLSVSFYNMIADENFDDPVEELPDYKREAFWKKKIEAEKVNGSSIIRITVFDEDQMVVEDLGEKVALNVAEVLSRYYNINTELDSRIVNGPTVSYGMKNNIFILILESLLGGLIFVFSVFAVNYILGILGIGKKIESKKAKLVRKLPIISKEEVRGLISFDKKPVDFKKIDKQSKEQESYIQKTNFPEILGKKSAAPENLPIADESMFQKINSAESVKTEKIREEKRDNEIEIREATPEEVKERLNKLLRGDL